MPLEVIGTGFGRTGTDSMRAALNILGFGPTHHMLEIRNNPDHEALWYDLVQGAAPDWTRLFEGYRACVDWPSVYFWRELIEFYPDARVILTWRTPESWWASFERTILRAHQQMTPDEPHKIGKILVSDRTFGGMADDREHVINVYKAHVDEVIATVPEERLLIHRLGDGWEPLCAHLGVSVPDQDYPNRNKPDQFFENLRGDNKP